MSSYESLSPPSDSCLLIFSSSLFPLFILKGSLLTELSLEVSDCDVFFSLYSVMGMVTSSTVISMVVALLGSIFSSWDRAFVAFGFLGLGVDFFLWEEDEGPGPGTGSS